MSTLKTNNIEHLDASTPAIQVAVGGGVNISGVTTVGDNLTIDGTNRNITTGVGQTVGFGTDISIGGNLKSNGNSFVFPNSGGTLDRLERAGNILQVKQTHLTTRFSVSYTAGTDFDITDLNVSITPSSTDNKILVFARMSYEVNDSNNQDIVFNLRRNGTYVGKTSDAPGDRRAGIAGIFQGYWDADFSSTPDSMAFNYLDSPNSTDPLTYQVSSQSRQGSVLYVNRAVNDNSNVAYEWLTSSITVMEVAG